VYGQRDVPDYDGDYPSDHRIRFRVGVNSGDVIPDGTNLHGEGIPIATQLQAICPPGSICVSRVVRDRPENMAQPIEAFLLELAATTLLLASNAVASTLFACAATAIIIIIAVPNTAGLHL
jgi:class 3 adenylate cyclase